MSYECCGIKFSNTRIYIDHLKLHNKNLKLSVTCNECGQISSSWNAFKKHNNRNHPHFVFESNYAENVEENIDFDIEPDITLEKNLQEAEILAEGISF